MNILVDFFSKNHNLYFYLLYIVTLFSFTFIARMCNHFVILYVEKSPFRRKDVVHLFTPFLILFFIIAGESFFSVFFNLTLDNDIDIGNSFSFFLNTQIVWAFFWLVMAVAKFGIYELPITNINWRKFYPSLRILFLLILLALIVTRNLNHIISALLGFGITFLLLRVSFMINQIQIGKTKGFAEEEGEKIIARWDSFNITLPYNTPQEIVDKAIKLAEECVKETDNIGKRASVLLKDLSERGIVIEVKYLVLDSVKMKKTKHNLLSRTLKSFSEQNIPMSPS